jgi:hypothetical protein
VFEDPEDPSSLCGSLMISVDWASVPGKAHSNHDPVRTPVA